MEFVNITDRSLAKHLLQQIRDEAHRFAITGHRAKRDKKQMHSVLEDLPGIGAKRRKSLLTHLGGWQQIKHATIEQLATVPGISASKAKMIYDHLHETK
jgi:excinuclease ABC subunit C